MIIFIISSLLSEVLKFEVFQESPHDEVKEVNLPLLLSDGVKHYLLVFLGLLPDIFELLGRLRVLLPEFLNDLSILIDFLLQRRILLLLK